MQTVKIRLQGLLDKNWSDWLEDFRLTHTDEGETILEGQVNDQAALYGLIAKLRDLGIKLREVNITDIEV